MPNQLAKTKRRQSLTEHEAVLAALAAIAKDEETTTMSLMRQAVRDLISKHTSDPDQLARLRSIVMQYAPEPPKHFRTAAQLARYKRNMRDFDKVLLDLRLATAEMVESRNSLVPQDVRIRILELE